MEQESGLHFYTEPTVGVFDVRVPFYFQLVYSSELFCGIRSGEIRGATGQMSELVGGWKLAMERCKSGEEGGG
jgi:hypothetical protein